MSAQGAGNLHILTELQSGLSADLFESLVENFPDIIHSVNRDGKIVSTNRRAVELLGYEKAELIGMDIFELYADEIKHLVRSGFEELKQTGFNDGIESKLKAKNGEIIDVEIRSLSLYDGDNTFDRTFSIIRDIRDKKAIQAQLYQQSKLAGIGELAAGIVHDIRNPLAVVNGLARNGLQKVIDGADLDRLTDIREKILKASNRIDRLCSHLRDYMRQEHEHASPTQLKTLVEDALLICENRVKSSQVKVINNITDPTLEFSIPSNSVEQVLINIISNACDAVEGCPVREVRIRVREGSSERVVFEVEDTGPGVPVEARARIFESFFTTKGKGKGTGLGLSICTGLLEEHKGSLALDENYTGGARFVISVPVS